MHVVRFLHEGRGEYRLSASPFRVRKWHTRAEAEAFAETLNARKGIRNAHVVELEEPEKARLKPEGVLTWAKWTLLRAKVRFGARRRGMVRTSGDRTYNSLASVGRTSDHWEERLDSWAEDFWHPEPGRMYAYADALRPKVSSTRDRSKLKQVLVHDAGSGLHLHVAGWT